MRYPCLDEQTLPGGYTIEILKKQIKHVYFKIFHESSIVRVTAPHHIDDQSLDKIIASKQPWIEQQVQIAASRPDAFPVPYYSGKDVCLFGTPYPVVGRKEKSSATVLVDGGILYISDLANQNRKRKLIDIWLRNELKNTAQNYIAKWEPEVGRRVLDCRVRKMRTRWGSCNLQKSRIWLNFALVHLPKVYLEYVVVHEMVHLLERYHNKRFYRFMDQFLPNWQQLKIELNSFVLSF